MILSVSLSDIGSWASIVSLIATAVIAFTTSTIKTKVQRMVNFRNFKTDRETLENELRSIASLLTSDDHGYDKMNASDLTTVLRKMEYYKPYMNISDKYAFWRCKQALKKGLINGENHKLIYDIGILIGFLSARVEIELRNI
ncbi:hypothetical protein [Terribacillus saccharophilus]|uniref:hypothetical protein n=1 Tax=Terribacillus saccharophilus TaxID=361277 RepID=UPI002DC153B2|nr:hypothetical protein [Terribacillus saccharophilus]MEC0288823.1 hypothetical protein [Terribacillus saccharophilus]